MLHMFIVFYWQLKYNKLNVLKVYRLVLVLMQTKNKDTLSKFQSVDKTYYNYIRGWFAANNQKAVLDYHLINDKEIKLKVGYIISNPGAGYGSRKINLFNGYSFRRNLRTWELECIHRTKLLKQCSLTLIGLQILVKVVHNFLLT